MIISIRRKEYYNDEFDVLEDCGNCYYKEDIRVTRASIIEAIEEHRLFIKQLEELLREIECQPSQP